MWPIDCPCKSRGETVIQFSKLPGFQIDAFSGRLTHGEAVLVCRRCTIIGFFILAARLAIAGITDIRRFRSNRAGYHGILLTDGCTIPLNTILAILGAGAGGAELPDGAVLNVI